MPTISTIMPAGGGDFTTLQAWEDFADDQASADQWAECYSGGDLGALVMTGWAATPNSSTYPRVYAADGHRHDGDIGSGAYISSVSGFEYVNVGVSFTQVDGLRMSGQSGRVAFQQGVSSAVAENCLIQNNGGVPQNLLFNSCTSTTARNNILIGGALWYASNTSNCTGVAYSNTIYNGLIHGNENAFNISVTLRNNIIVRGGGDCVTFGAGTPTFSSDYNIVSDGSLTARGIKGANDLESQSATTVLADAANDDFTLAAESPALDSGVDLTAQGITHDCRGVSRPQGEGWDRGAFEMEAGGSGGEGSGGSGEGSQPGSGSGGSAGSSGSDGSGGSGGSLPSLTGRPRFVSPSTMNPFKPHKSPFQR